MEPNELEHLRQTLSARLTLAETEAWLHTSNAHLGGRSPLDAIADGDLQAVERAAEAITGSSAPN